jgi:hypothetical protein
MEGGREGGEREREGRSKGEVRFFLFSFLSKKGGRCRKEDEGRKEGD